MRIPLDTVVSFPVITTPVEFHHVTTGVSDVFPTSVPLQMSVYICPATGLPDVVRLMECNDTAEGNNMYVM